MIKPGAVEELEAVARDAARIFDQDYDSLPEYSQSRWRDIVRDVNVTAPQTVAEQAAALALQKWARRNKRET